MYEEAGHEEECRREHVVRALLHIDHDLSEKVARQVGNSHAAWPAGCWGRLRLRWGSP